MFAGTGTARSAVLDYLGIGGTEKSVILSLIPESDEENIMRELRARMSLYLVGRGISFTIPLSAVSQIVSNGLESAAAEKTIDVSKIMKDEQRQYDLSSRSRRKLCRRRHGSGALCGSCGAHHRARSLHKQRESGTVHRHFPHARAGTSLYPHERERKLAIMQALSEKVGLKTEAGGVIFSVPVDKTAGIAVAAEAQEAKEGQA